MAQFVRVVTHDIDEAFRVFDSQNYRGKPLAPHDLLKAHHLREMRDETAATRSAAVEGWESVSDNDLNRLFSTYLHRIACWTRGESAPRFAAKDIWMFKGNSGAAARSPSARYHLVAQSAVPMFGAWAAASASTDPKEREAEARELRRTRFQLDAPTPVGRGFFEMVTFMLDELRRLRLEAFRGREEFASFDCGSRDDDPSDREALEEIPSRSRFRYVSELYVAALLYYTNRFGDEELDTARHRLFAWAFTLRATLRRVQLRSIDNRGRGAHDLSAFVLMRNAQSGRVVNRLPSSSTPPTEGHEASLIEHLRSLEAR